jgi:AraC-like DNA-binding protein
MSVVYRATDEPVATREDYWRHVLDETVVPMEVRFDDGPELRDELVTSDLGPMRVTESTTGPGMVVRAPRHIRRSDPELYQFVVQAEGTVVGEQGDRRAELRPGDMALTDLSRPFRCAGLAKRSVLVTFPRELLPLRPVEATRLLGTRIPGDEGTGALVSTLVRQLPERIDDAGSAARGRLGAAVLDLITATLTARLGDSPAERTESRQVQLQRIHGFIEARLADPDLTPSTVAAAHHVSVRYLHRLFEGQGQSVAGLIRQRRLDRCRAELLDPRLAYRPVSATAARWGFVNPAHFSRLFKDTFGLPPGEFRVKYGSQHTAAAS